MSHPPTQEQARAIELRDRDIFLEAGAGTGKTRVLVERYCEAVGTDGVQPERILAFTFTERAAAELRHRIRGELAGRARLAREAKDMDLARELRAAARDSERSWITTIHGFCRRLLATHAASAELDPRFRVLDEPEAQRLADRAFRDALEALLAEDDGRVRTLAAGYRVELLGAHLREAHERLRSQGVEHPQLPDPGPPRRSAEAGKEAVELTPAEASRARDALAVADALLGRFHDRYEALKAERSGADFEDLELRALAVLRTETVGAAWRERFDHVMVDEFQDTNRVQLALIEALRGPETRVFTVGDEHQSIYRFRHADLDVFRARRAEIESAADSERLPLRGNFRSRPAVLAAINTVGAALLDGFGGLITGREEEPEPVDPRVELLLTDTSGDGWRPDEVADALDPPPSEGTPACVAEARALAERLGAMTRERGVARGDIVVLLRAFTHVDAFEDALERAGLAPYVIGGRGYWSQQQVEDMLHLLATIANPLDDETLFGALAAPACGVSPDALWLLRVEAGKGQHIWPVISEGAWGQRLDGDDSARLERFRETLGVLRDDAPLLPLDVLIERTMVAFDYDLSLLAKRGGRRRMANVRKLMRLARDYEALEGRDLRGFLELAEERTVRDEREGQAAIQVEGHDGVRIMTVHAAKGLQFPVVAVADLGRDLVRGGGSGMLAIGRVTGDPPDPRTARLGMRLSIAANEPLRLWDLHELDEEDRVAEAQEGCRLVYVATTRAEERLILSGTYKESHLDRADPRPSDSPLRRLLPALVERGWDGQPGEVGLDAPAHVDGRAPEGPPLLMRVAVSRPSVERARELRLEGLAATATESPSYGAPPLLDDRASRAGVGHLSYSALADYERCGYRFYVERVVGLAPLAEGDPAGDPGDRTEGPGRESDELMEPGPDTGAATRRLGLAIGNAVHAGLEWSARNAWAHPGTDRLAAELARAGASADDEALSRADELVAAWLGSPLRDRLAGLRLRPEVPFALGLAGTVVRGKIDLVAENGRDLLVIDYKTDALRGRATSEVAEDYATQRDLYALAAASAHGANGDGPRVSAAYCFLEKPDDEIVESYDHVRLGRARSRLEALIAGIGAGDFSRTEHPEPAICFGCPAAARLCGKPAWHPEG